MTKIALSDSTVEISARPARARVTFLTDDMFRLWVAPTGKFVDETDMVITLDYQGVQPEVADAGTYFRLTTAALVLRVYKEPLRFGLYRPDDDTLIAEEKRALSFEDDGATQYLTRGQGEQFFGGGMQNGRFSHRHKAIDIAVSYNWDDGGCPNSVPFYLSSAGYGVFRHTFAPG
ncbi:MAG: glycoside hydrolase, partial [Acidimicrobiia bacterium]